MCILLHICSTCCLLFAVCLLLLLVLAGGRDPPVCWCPPRCGAPLRAPRGVVCPPVVDACPVCCPPLRWVLAPCAGAPPRCCGPDRDHCYDRLEATAPHRIHSLAPCRHQGSGHPHAYGSCVRRAGTVHAVIHSTQQAFSQQSSGAAASRSRSHSSATNKYNIIDTSQINLHVRKPRYTIT